MEDLVTAKFGGKLSLEVKVNAFVHIAFKIKEILVGFTN